MNATPRRRLRELSRLHLLPDDSKRAELGIPYDVVLIARPAALVLPVAVLEKEVLAVRARLQGSGGLDRQGRK